MAMSPLVLDEEELAANEAAEESAATFRPGSATVPVSAPVQSVPVPDTGASAAQPVYAGVPVVARDDGQGDSSADRQTRRDVSPAHGKWGIQVGAHLSRDGAETQLKQVQAHARDLIGQAKSAIVQLEVNGETFYRVRFGAFTPAKAESLCEKLQKRGTSCLVVTDGAWDQASARASLPIAVR
jgi:cell division protein FtsN